MTEFRKQVLSQDDNWAAAFWFEMLYDIKPGHQIEGRVRKR